MIGYASDFEVSVYDPKLLRLRVNEARVLEGELSQTHGYSKYKPHLDFLEAIELSNYMTLKQYDALVRPYLMQRIGDLRW